jgi:hypothetical protein
MKFRYTISHVPGKDLIIADALSRAPSRNIEKSESDFENDTTAFVDMIMESFPGTWEIVYLNLISLMRNRCNLGVNSSRFLLPNNETSGLWSVSM